MILEYKAGMVIQFTEGSYSDYRLSGNVVTLKDINLIDLAKKYWDECKETIKYNWCGKEKTSTRIPHTSPDFSAWLIMKEYVFPANIEEVHLGEDFDLHKR